MNFTAVLIDDDYGPMDYYIEALRLRGFDVRHLDSTDKAFSWIDAANSKTPDIVILDVMLPPGTRLTLEETDGGLRSGVSIGKAVRKRFPRAPIVALTNYNDPEVVKLLPQGTKYKAKFEISPFAFATFVLETLEG